MQRVTRLPLLVNNINNANNMLQLTCKSEEECDTGSRAFEALKEVRFRWQFCLSAAPSISLSLLSLSFTACQKVQRDHEVDGADGEDADSVPKARLQRGATDRAPDIGHAVAGEGIQRGLGTWTRSRKKHPGKAEYFRRLGSKAAPLPSPVHRHTGGH